MPIYMRFEEDRHVETTTLSKKPDGDNWTKAPADFEWNKAYCLIDGKITVQSDDSLLAWALATAKTQALQNIRTLIDAKRKQYVGYSPEKSQGYAVKADVADKIMGEEDASAYIHLIEPLAKLRGITVIDMAKLIQGKAREAARALLQCEFLEDQAKQTISAVKSKEDLESLISTFNGTLGDV